MEKPVGSEYANKIVQAKMRHFFLSFSYQQITVRLFLIGLVDGNVSYINLHNSCLIFLSAREIDVTLKLYGIALAHLLMINDWKYMNVYDRL